MVSIPTKVTTDQFIATECNQLADELEQVVTDSGQTPNAGILDQVSKGIATIVSNVDYYTDGGAADAYVLSVIAPNKAPHSYRNGMRIRFRTTNVNTGASIVNVATLGIKNIKKQDGTDPDAGDVSIIVENEAVYDGTSFKLKNKIEPATVLAQGITYLDKYFLYSLVPSSNSVTPDEQVDVTAGKCLAQDGITILTLGALTADLTNHITPGVDTTYHLFAYEESVGGTHILDFSTSLTPTVGTGDANLPDLDGTKYRRIGSVVTDGSSNIIHFKSIATDGSGIRVRYDAGILDRGAGVVPTTRTPLPLSTPPSVIAMVSCTYGGDDATSSFIVLSEEGETDVAASSSNATVTGDTDSYGAGNTTIKTNSSSQIYYRGDDGSDVNFFLTTRGFFDNRNNY